MRFFLVFLLLSTILLGTVYAQDETPKYNFASMQADKAFTLAPGETGITKLYFFNIAGNRNTHIALSTNDLPENWEVSFEPELHDSEVLISGVPVTFTENTFVVPSDAVDEIPRDIPEGIEYISTAVGYVGAKSVEISIKVPLDADLGTVESIRVDAAASWAGQTGAAAISQGRSFDYTVTVASKEFTEETFVQEIVPVGEPEPEAEDEATEVVEATQVDDEEQAEAVTLSTEEVTPIDESTSTGTSATVVILLVIVIALLAILVVLFVKKR